jgi:hypothetical protein
MKFSDEIPIIEEVRKCAADGNFKMNPHIPV